MTDTKIMTQGCRPRFRTIARVAAVQALFQILQTGDEANTVIQQFLDTRLGRGDENYEDYEDGILPKADRRLFTSIVQQAMHERELITQKTEAALPEGWPLPRLDPVMQTIIWAAAAEMTMSGEDKAPVKVIINEYMDVAHGFFIGEEPRMINGVLDALGRRLRQEEHGAQDVDPHKQDTEQE